MTVKFDFGLEAWVRQLIIKADSLEDAIEKFDNMTLSEILADESFLADSTYKVTDLDTLILDQDIVVKVTDIEYDFEDTLMNDSVVAYLEQRLPKERVYTLKNMKATDVEEEFIKNAILDDTSYEAKSFKFQILEKK